MLKVASYIGLAVVFLWFFVGGISHFTQPEFFLAIMPPYIPWQLPVVFVSGALEVVFAVALLPPATRQMAGNLLIALTVAVTPVNVYMWLNPELFPDVAPAMLTLRLFIQAALLALIWWSTRNTRWRTTTTA